MNVLISGCVGIITALLITWLLLMIWLLVRRIMRYHAKPVQQIATLPSSGSVIVRGQATGKELTSPLAHAPCVFWHIQVFEFRSSRRRKGWTVQFEQTSQESFTLSDGTGSVIINPATAYVKLKIKMAEKQNSINELSPALIAMISEQPFANPNFLATERKLRVVEARIEAGDQIQAIGTLVDSQAQPTLESVGSERLFLTDDLLKEHVSLYAILLMTILMTLPFIFLLRLIIAIVLKG